MLQKMTVPAGSRLALMLDSVNRNEPGERTRYLKNGVQGLKGLPVKGFTS